MTMNEHDSPSSPDVAPPVMVLVYEHWETTFEVLATYYDAYPNIWLIDNHSPTDRSDEVRARFPKVRLIRTPYNGGWAYGYNQALALAASERHRSAYLINNDAAPLPGAVESALAALEATPGAAAVGSVILDWAGETIEYDGRLYLPGEGPPADTAPTGLRQSRRVHGAGTAISLEALEALGPFHEDYFLYHEETDWLLRAMAAGWTLWVDGGSRVRHVAGASDANSNSRYYLTRNRFLAYRRGVYLSEKPETLTSVLFDEAAGLYHPNSDTRFAAKQGLIDGLKGRTGPRPKAPPRALVEALILPLRIAMKIRTSLSGRRAA